MRVAPGWARPVGARLAYAALFVAMGGLGRTTIVDERALSLVWPAAGIAVLWFLRADSRGRWRWFDCVLLALLALEVNWATGSTLDMAWVLMIANLAQVLVIVTILQRTLPGLGQRYDRRVLDNPRALLRLVEAAATGCLVGVALGTLGMYLVDDFFSWSSAFIWWGRNLCGVLGVGAVGLLLLEGRAQWRAPGSQDPNIARAPELLALVGCTTALFTIDYANDFLPLAFLLPALTVWAGMRFPPLTVAVHAVLSGSAAIWLTIEGKGPFALVEPIETAALLAQLFVGMTLALGLFLAMSREDNNRLQAHLIASERSETEKAELLHAVLESMGDAVVVVDRARMITYVNPAAERALPFAVGEAVGLSNSAYDLFRVDGTLMADEDRPVVRAMNGESIAAVDIRLEPGTQGVLYSCSAAPLAIDQEGPGGAVVVFRDVTLERSRERDLAVFASVIAHDLNNPLSLVTGWSEVLRQQIGDGTPAPARAKQLETLGRIERAGQRMKDLVSGLLADVLSRQGSLRSGRVDLNALLHDIVESRQAGPWVRATALPEVFGDEALLRQLFDNLVGNALKYVAPGQLPDVEVTGELDGDRLARLSIRDHGIGVPEEDRERIFGDLYRAHEEYVGTGLGLSISRRIAERHRGRIEATAPDDGVGTVFHVWLPAYVGQSSVARALV